MTTGRKPIPTQIKKMQGTLEKSRVNKAEPDLPVSIPKIPDYFDKYAIEAFEFLGVKTYEMRIVTEADKMALELLAESYSEYRKAIEIIKDKGLTYSIRDRSGNEIIKPRPENLIKDKAMNRMRSLLTEFGLTPSSRARVNAKEKIEISDIENLID